MGYIERRAWAWIEAAETENNPYLDKDWQTALRWESDVSDEFFDLFEAVEEAAARLMPEGKATGAAAITLQRLEKSYNRLWTAKRAVDRAAGEVLDAFSRQLRDTTSLNRARQERARKEAIRNAELERLRERRGA